MRKSLVLSAVSAALLAGCAAPGGSPTMSEAELIECLQPNRRVVVEVGGLALKPKPKPKPPAEGAKPEAKPEAKPDAKPEAKPDAKPEAKPPKPQFIPVEEVALAQGNTAFDPNSAVLKDGGRQELDQLMATLKKRAIKVNSIIISGHTDRFEAKRSPDLAEQRARSVKDYLVERGLDEKLMFWEGKGDREAVAVTKFCE
jgi:outer membrane protein OmpA-like peptidoglycan-associated protein